MTHRFEIVGHEQDDRQRIVNAVRAARIDHLAPDHREAVLAAERYLDDESAYGKATEQQLRQWRRRVSGVWMSEQWRKQWHR